MPRKRKGRAISGWLAIDKPLGLTSSQVVGKVRRLTDAAKAGHGGTLDPLATGILPIALGEATKTSAYVMDGSKTYAFTICFGEARSTEDREGEVTAVSDVRPTAAEIEAVLPRFVGEIEQVPPVYSAIKIDGRRAYEMARKDEAPEMVARTVHIESITLLAMPDGDHAEILVTCGKGTYVRSLARDIALALGTVGHVSALRRTACGPFNEENAISLEKLETLGHSAAPSEYLLPIETALDGIPALALSESEANRLFNGQALSVLNLSDRGFLETIEMGATIRAMRSGRIVALAKVEKGKVQPVRIINPDAERNE